MYQDKVIAVVIPAYNEEKLVGRVIETMPEFVDHIIAVDDASEDQTLQVVESFLPRLQNRLLVIHHDTNQGVGAAIISGHQKALEIGADISVVMAGDAQMDPIDLPTLLDPVVSKLCDYSKGNRFFGGEAWKNMPRVRFFANAGLSMLNKIASGYWHIADPQCGYTAISSTALRKINLASIRKRYHFENSMLFHLNIENLKVMDVPIRAVYGIGESSGINEIWAFFSFAIVLQKIFIDRLIIKYVIRDFHPLVFFYLFGFIFFLVGSLLGIYLLLFRTFVGLVQSTSAIFAAFLFTSGLQLTLFGMLFDKDYSQNSS